MTRRRLPRTFYNRPTESVARDLLGKVLAHATPDGVVSGRIVETEAYVGRRDPGSHAFRGPTNRNRVMFGPAGYVYVYVSYGAHVCMNVVTEAAGVAGAVLLRALEPVDGIEIMERNRGGKPLQQLCNGPGKLCQALGITLDDYGQDLEGGTIWIEDDGVQGGPIAVSTRIGLSAGADLPLRFFIAGSPFVSRGKPSSAGS